MELVGSSDKNLIAELANIFCLFHVLGGDTVLRYRSFCVCTNLSFKLCPTYAGHILRPLAIE